MPWILAKKKVLQSISFNESKISNNELVTVILESHWRRRCVYNTYECIDIFVYIYRGLSRWDNGKVSAWQCKRRKRCKFHPLVGRSPGVGNGYLLQYFCLENSLARGAWRAMQLHGVAKSHTWKRLSTYRYRVLSTICMYIQYIVYFITASYCLPYARLLSLYILIHFSSQWFHEVLTIRSLFYRWEHRRPREVR